MTRTLTLGNIVKLKNRPLARLIIVDIDMECEVFVLYNRLRKETEEVHFADSDDIIKTKPFPSDSIQT